MVLVSTLFIPVLSSLLNCTVDLGKVLTGIQVPLEDYDQFQQFLDDLGYHYVEETNNEMYKRYLRG